MKINLKDIDISKEYNGYIWLSDESKPQIMDKSSVNFYKYENTNPFIQEGYFTDDEFSYTIKHFDGIGHCVYKTKIDELKNGNEEISSYLADPALTRENEKIKKLKFITEWIAENDEKCDNMEVLKPGRVAFIGFDDDNTKKRG